MRVPAPAYRRARHQTPFVSQLGEADCGPACLTAVLRSFGLHPSLSEVSRWCGVGRDGASLGDLARVAQRYGVSATGLRLRLRGEAGDAARLAVVPTPAIAQVDHSHFVVIEGVHRGTVAINDPALGRSRTSVERFAERVDGVLLALTPPADGFRPTSRASRRSAESWSVRRWWRTEPTGISALAVVAVLLGVAAVGAALAVTALVRSVARAGAGAASPPWPALAGLAVLAVGAHWAQRRIRSAILLRTATRRGGDLVQTLLGLPTAYFQTRFTGELASRSQRVDGACMQVAAIVVGGGTQIVAAVGALAGVLVLAPLAVPVLLAGVAASMSLHLRDVGAESTSAQQSLTEKAGRDGEIVSSLVAIETVKAEAGSGRLLASWSASQNRSLRLGELSAHRTQRRRRVSAALDQLTVLGVVVLIGAGVLGAPLGPGELIIVMILASLFQAAAGGAAQQGIFDATGVRAAMRMVEDIEDAAAAASAGTGAPNTAPAVAGAAPEPRGAHERDLAVPGSAIAGTPGWISPISGPASVRLRGVSVGYHPYRPALLADVDLDIPAGRITFVTGRTGAGKSTLAKVVTGTITSRGGELRFGPGRHRSRPDVSYVPQRPVLLEGTVAENVLFGAPEALRRDVSAALALTCLGEVVAVRGGAELARVSQDGANFSGGERQRIALARALLRRPELLILDEATSSMEEPLEQEIMSRLRATGITVLAVAHRLPAVHDNDQVVHVGDRRVRVVQPGTSAVPADVGAL